MVQREHWSFTVTHTCILSLLHIGQLGFRIKASDKHEEQNICPQ